ncbi:UNVERIFIED_CONTAM: protein STRICTOSIDINE SYNTHASE-LIKE 2 [Sesamum radiatum]|uniref:Protein STRICTOSIDINE SYNTHASE-LIKE 2 n=1 Tax=Sesamum radiatum TaxID=300843 RepID=A0AAW2TJZ2_SESRA
MVVKGGHDHSQTEHICGRPLGLRFNEKTGDLYITDAYMGLLVVGPNGGLATPLAQQLDGLAFGFTNSLDIDHNTGVVYFTDSSTRFPRRNYVSVIISGDDTGRLMKFDPITKKTTLLLNNLKFPNGIALSKNGDFLLFVETTTCRLFKFWLKSAKAGNLEVLAQLPGFPDNIKRNSIGEFWVGINSRFLEWVVSNSWIGNGLILVSPVDVTKVHSYLGGLIGGMGMGIRLDGDGNVVEVLDSGEGKGKRWKFVSEVEEYNGNLWVGSVTRSFVIRQKLPMSLD